MSIAYSGKRNKCAAKIARRKAYCAHHETKFFMYHAHAKNTSETEKRMFKSGAHRAHTKNAIEAAFPKAFTSLRRAPTDFHGRSVHTSEASKPLPTRCRYRNIPARDLFCRNNPNRYG